MVHKLRCECRGLDRCCPFCGGSGEIEYNEAHPKLRIRDRLFLALLAVALAATAFYMVKELIELYQMF